MEQRTILTTISASLAVFLMILALSALVEPEGDRFYREKLEESPHEAVVALNARNASADRVSCEIGVGLVGRATLFFRRPADFLFRIWVVGREEASVGCCGDDYWFWIDSFRKDSVYFCGRGDLGGTVVRPLLRPEVVCSVAWVELIPEGSEVLRTARGFRTDVVANGFRKVVEFDSEKILAQSMFFEGKRVVTVEGERFEEFSGLVLPVVVRATWHEEDVSGTFPVRRWVVNGDDFEISEPRGKRRLPAESLGSVPLPQ